MSNTDAIRDLWEVDLEQEDLPARIDPSGEARLAALLCQASIPILDTPPEETWIWSDLHLADRSALFSWDRPFGDVVRMNHHLLREWRHRVRPGDTIICLGDVAHPDAWRDRRLMLDVRNCPGRRVLILGNHDVEDTEALRDAGFVEQHASALCATEPALAPCRPRIDHATAVGTPARDGRRMAVTVPVPGGRGPGTRDAAGPRVPEDVRSRRWRSRTVRRAPPAGRRSKPTSVSVLTAACVVERHAGNVSRWLRRPSERQPPPRIRWHRKERWGSPATWTKGSPQALSTSAYK